jgi:hypothetical protein
MRAKLSASYFLVSFDEVPLDAEGGVSSPPAWLEVLAAPATTCFKPYCSIPARRAAIDGVNAICLGPVNQTSYGLDMWRLGLMK